ncbi:hypothetical protein U1Q18_014300 [Sarracenia purpurea var. burkii]
MELTKDILVKAFVVKKALELGYNAWVLDGNMLDIKALFVRSSSSSKKVWAEDFIDTVAVMAESLKSKGLFSMDGGNFAYIVAKILEQKGVKIKGIDEKSIGVNIDVGNLNRTSTEDGKKMV